MAEGDLFDELHCLQEQIQAPQEEVTLLKRGREFTSVSTLLGAPETVWRVVKRQCHGVLQVNTEQ